MDHKWEDRTFLLTRVMGVGRQRQQYPDLFLYIHNINELNFSHYYCDDKENVSTCTYFN